MPNITTTIMISQGCFQTEKENWKVDPRRQQEHNRCVSQNVSWRDGGRLAKAVFKQNPSEQQVPSDSKVTGVRRG
jgi:hypothetical protein